MFPSRIEPFGVEKHFSLAKMTFRHSQSNQTSKSRLQVETSHPQNRVKKKSHSENASPAKRRHYAPQPTEVSDSAFSRWVAAVRMQRWWRSRSRYATQSVVRRFLKARLLGPSRGWPMEQVLLYSYSARRIRAVAALLSRVRLLAKRHRPNVDPNVISPRDVMTAVAAVLCPDGLGFSNDVEGDSSDVLDFTTVHKGAIDLCVSSHDLLETMATFCQTAAGDGPQGATLGTTAVAVDAAIAAFSPKLRVWQGLMSQRSTLKLVASLAQQARDQAPTIPHDASAHLPSTPISPLRESEVYVASFSSSSSVQSSRMSSQGTEPLGGSDRDQEDHDTPSSFFSTFNGTARVSPGGCMSPTALNMTPLSPISPRLFERLPPPGTPPPAPSPIKMSCKHEDVVDEEPATSRTPDAVATFVNVSDSTNIDNPAPVISEVASPPHLFPMPMPLSETLQRPRFMQHATPYSVGAVAGPTETELMQRLHSRSETVGPFVVTDEQGHALHVTFAPASNTLSSTSSSSSSVDESLNSSNGDDDDLEAQYPTSATIVLGIEDTGGAGLAGIFNEGLSHALLLNSTFRLARPPFGTAAMGGITPPPPGDLQAHVQRMRCIDEYWCEVFDEFDAFSSTSTKPALNTTQSPRLTALLIDMKGQLTAVCPHPLRPAIAEVLDLSHIDQQVRHGVLGWDGITKLVKAMSSILHTASPPDAMTMTEWNRVVEMMETAPARVAAGDPHAVHIALREGLLHVQDIVNIMRVQLANDRLGHVAGAVQQYGIDYERDMWEARLLCGEIRLDMTRYWLQSCTRELVNAQSATLGPLVDGDSDALQCLHGNALVALVQSLCPLHPATCPETLLLDLAELCGLQHRYLIHVALTGVLVASAPVVSSLPTAVRSRLVGSLCVAIVQPNLLLTSGESISATAALCYVRETGQEIPSSLLKVIGDSVTLGTPLNTVIRTRVGTVWRDVVLRRDFSTTARNFPLPASAVLPDLHTWAMRLRRIRDVDYAVHGSWLDAMTVDTATRMVSQGWPRQNDVSASSLAAPVLGGATATPILTSSTTAAHKGGSFVASTAQVSTPRTSADLEEQCEGEEQREGDDSTGVQRWDVL